MVSGDVGMLIGVTESHSRRVLPGSYTWHLVAPPSQVDKRTCTDKTAAKCLLSCGGLSSQLRLILAMGKDVLPFISLTSMTSSWPKPDGAVCEVSFQISKEEGPSLA